MESKGDTEVVLAPHDVHTEPPKLYVPAPQAMLHAVSEFLFAAPAALAAAGEDLPASQFTHVSVVAVLVVSSYLPAGHAWRGQRANVQQRGQSTAAG